MQRTATIRDLALGLGLVATAWMVGSVACAGGGESSLGTMSIAASADEVPADGIASVELTVHATEPSGAPASGWVVINVPRGSLADPSGGVETTLELKDGACSVTYFCDAEKDGACVGVQRARAQWKDLTASARITFKAPNSSDGGTADAGAGDSGDVNVTGDM